MSTGPDLRAVFQWAWNEAEAGDSPEQERCLFCNHDLTGDESFAQYRVCPECRFHYNLSARERIQVLADPGSFKEVNQKVTRLDPLSFSGWATYPKRLSEAQSRTGLSEAVVTGTCTIEGNPAMLAVLDFGFMGGSMGYVVGEKVTLALEQAIKKKMPLVTVVTSGGARLQEGLLSLMQMAKTTAAVQRLNAAGLPYISVLANPTTGEVYSSFANLGDVLIAERGALLGFAPLRVVSQTSGKPLPTGIHTAEFHLQRGLVDQVVDRSELRGLISAILTIFSSRRRPEAQKVGKKATQPAPQGPAPAWQRVQLARHKERPTALDYIGRMTRSFIEIRGDRVQGDDRAVICGLAQLGTQPVLLIGQERSYNSGRAYPEGFRKAQRALALAAKFQLPVITFIDTPGAYPGPEAEERGTGHAIASTLALLSSLPTPVISVVIGEGGSEGALALGVADRILMLENAIYFVVSPEGAASILYRNPERAQEVAPALKLTAADCLVVGVVDRIVPEPAEGAHSQPEEASRLLETCLLQELRELRDASPDRLVRLRHRKFRRMGEHSHYFRTALRREVTQMGSFLGRRVKGIRLRRGKAKDKKEKKAAPTGDQAGSQAPKKSNKQK